MRNALCLGTFDGVHTGHREVLSLPQHYRKIAVTFIKSPRGVITGYDEALMTFEEKCQAFEKLGFCEVYPLDFNQVKEISPEDFLEDLYNKFNPALISCGFNYSFGKDKKGDITLLKKFCMNKGIKLRCVEPVAFGGEIISSTYIRELLKKGEVEKANLFLFTPFSFTAKVTSGDKRGRTMGFPTANQEYPKELARLKFGVYKTVVSIDSKEYSGITNIGQRPTYPIDFIISETFIKDFSGDIYGKNVKITFLKFLREERKFDSLEDLKNQIQKDILK